LLVLLFFGGIMFFVGRSAGRPPVIVPVVEHTSTPANVAKGNQPSANHQSGGAASADDNSISTVQPPENPVGLDTLYAQSAGGNPQWADGETVIGRRLFEGYEYSFA